MLLLLLGVLSLLGISNAQVPSFLTKPKDAIVPFNLSANVTFFCAIDGNEIIWEVNNAQLDSERRRNDAEACEIYVEDESPSPDRNSSMLLITVREDNDNNGTTVVCIAEEDSVFDRVRSELVTIRTYGVPDPPQNLDLTISDVEGELTLVWDPPANIPPEVNDTVYLINIINGSGVVYPGEFPTMVNTMSATIVENGTECVLYTFEVRAMNQAGTGNSGIFMETIPLSPDADITIEDTVSLDEMGGPVISLSFNPARACSPNSPVPTYEIMIDDVAMNVLVPSSDDDPVNIVLTTANVPGGLERDTEYDITVVVVTEFSRTLSDPITVSTADVTGGTVTFIDEENRVYLTCSFITGALVQGCTFTFTLNNDVEVFNVTRDGETGAACATTLNHADVYERIEVEDWKEDGSLGNVNITITNLNLTTDLNAFNRLCPPISPGQRSASLSDGEIAGIVIGIVFAVIIAAAVIIILVIVFFRIKKELKVDKEGMIKITHIPLLHWGKKKVEEPESDDDEPVDGPRVLTEGDMGEPASEATTPMLTASPQPPHYDGIPAPDEPLTRKGVEALRSSLSKPSGFPDYDDPSTGLTAGVIARARAPTDPLEKLDTRPLPAAGKVPSVLDLVTLPSNASTITGNTIIPGKLPHIASLDLSNPKNVKMRLNPKVLAKVMRKKQRMNDRDPLLLYPEQRLQPTLQSLYQKTLIGTPGISPIPTAPTPGHSVDTPV